MPLMRALFAALALISQLTLGALVLPDTASARRADVLAARLDAAMLLCGSLQPGLHVDGKSHPHPAGTASGPLDVNLELPAVILMPAPALPWVAALSGATPVRLPPARAPPSPLAWALYVRGPPRLA